MLEDGSVKKESVLPFILEDGLFVVIRSGHGGVFHSGVFGPPFAIGGGGEQ